MKLRIIRNTKEVIPVMYRYINISVFNLISRDYMSHSIFFTVTLYADIVNLQFLLHKLCTRTQTHRIGMYHRGQ